MCAGFTCGLSPARSFPEREALAADSFAVACVAAGQVAVFSLALSISFSRPAAAPASRCWCALSRSIAAHGAPAFRPSGRVVNARFALCCGGIVPAAVGLSTARPGYRPTRRWQRRARWLPARRRASAPSHNRVSVPCAPSSASVANKTFSGPYSSHVRNVSLSARG